ncbi:MAG: PQQ-dependent sugar dehydrogenase [Flavobacteriales bacterium]|nr:MAG: PQQ-dependent sugar dehydrogenase [Flavobacteriales bacterium]
MQHQLLLDQVSNPSSVAVLPDNRMLVATLGGVVFITSPIDQPPLDLSIYMALSNINFTAEHGLAELVLDPDFANNGYFYIYYSTFANKNRVSRFIHHDSVADLSDEFVVWETVAPFSDCCHTGGALNITPDGKILLAVGDDFTPALAQSTSSPYGKVHRFNTDGTVPADNPYYDATPGLFNANGALKTIYSMGLRSPFRGAYDAVNARFYVSEVGGNDINVSWEDLHLCTPAANFGWPACGDGGRGIGGDCLDPAFSDPVFTYQHNGVGASIMAGFVYDGTMFGPAYEGKLFYADYVRNWIRCLTLAPNGSVIGDEVFLDPDSMGGVEPQSVVKLLQGPDGSLIYVSFADGIGGLTGSVHRIFIAPDYSPVCGTISATPQNDPGPTVQVQFNASATDPEGLPLTYTWAFGDGSGTFVGAAQTHTFNGEGVYEAIVVVSDGNSSTVCEAPPITVGIPPTVQIISPANGSFFQAGQVVEFTALATDDEPVPPTTYVWTVQFQHDAHTHPEAGASGGATFDLVVPTDGHGFSGNTWYRVTVTVTDADGIQASTSIEVFPLKVQLGIQTVPQGLEVIVEGLPLVAPSMLDHAVGSKLVVSVPLSTQCFNGVSYAFTGWSDGGALTHEYTVGDANATLTAFYTPVGACGECGHALSFDGADDLVSFTPFTIVGDFTLEFWMNAAAGLSSADAIVGNNSDFSLDLDNGRIRFFKVADRLTGSQQVIPGQWHHYAITRAGNALKLYVDGVQDVAASASPFTGTIWSHALGKGAFAGSFNGELDEMRLWNNARSAALIAANRNGPVDPASNGLVGYWSFDALPVQQEVSDHSQAGRNGVRGYTASTESSDPSAVLSNGPMSQHCPRAKSFMLRTYLQGPYDTNAGLMRDDLRATGALPFTEPYTQLGFLRAGTTGESTAPGVLAVNGPDAIVDWVLLEFRSAVNPAVVVATHALLLQRDGDLISPSGQWPVMLPVEEPAYYVALRHRNHFGVMTAAPVAMDGSVALVDFTSTGQTVYGTNALTSEGGVLLQWAGNTTLDALLKYVGMSNDRDPILQAIGGNVPTAVVNAYSVCDVNLDGAVKYAGAANDRDPILVNIGGSIPTNVGHEQLP